MSGPISIRLNDDVREELEAQATARGIGLATLLREVATRAAREARRQRIREASESVGVKVKESLTARAFYEDWGRAGSDTDA